MEYAIIDIETSGGKPKESKIIEIAIIIHDGTKVIEEYQTLVNPEKKIDWFVTKLTGIKNDDVKSAPKFYEVAKTVFKLLENRIFVAHNIGFDYPIVRNEFKSLGLDIRIPHLCTIQSARVLLPGLDSYGLKKLSAHLNISLDNHHRAMDDTLATAAIFKHLFEMDKNGLDSFVRYDINPKILHENLNLDEYDDLPNKTGVYYFYNDKNELIYIGKSIHIKKRVDQHLKNGQTNKAIEMRSKISKIDYELTGSELISLLLESELIKKHQPIYNRAQKTTVYGYEMYVYKDGKGYSNIGVKKNNSIGQPIHTFKSSTEAKVAMEGWINKYQLCQKLSGQYKSDSACFNYSIEQCNGACIGNETVSEYNKKIDNLINDLNFNKKSFLILDKGKTNQEYSFVCIIDGEYIGYGNALKFLIKKDKNNYKKFLKKQDNNRDFKSIINSQLKKNSKLELIEL